MNVCQIFDSISMAAVAFVAVATYIERIKSKRRPRSKVVRRSRKKR